MLATRCAAQDTHAAALRSQCAAIALCEAQLASLHVLLVHQSAGSTLLNEVYSALKRAISDLGSPANDSPGGHTPSEASLTTLARVSEERSDVVSQSLRRMAMDMGPKLTLEAAFADIEGSNLFSWTVPDGHGPWDPSRHALNRRHIRPTLAALAGRGELPGAEQAAPLLLHTGGEVARADTAHPAAPLQTCHQVIAEAIHHVRVAAGQASEILRAKRLQADQRRQTGPQEAGPSAGAAKKRSRPRAQRPGLAKAPRRGARRDEP